MASLRHKPRRKSGFHSKDGHVTNLVRFFLAQRQYIRYVVHLVHQPTGY